MKHFSPTLLMALQDAAAVVYWSRRDFQTFLEATIPAHEVLDPLNWNDTKRNTSAALIRALAANPMRYGPHLANLLDEVCRMDDFPHLDRSDPTGRLTTDARSAIERLRKCVARLETANPPIRFLSSRSSPKEISRPF